MLDDLSGAELLERFESGHINPADFHHKDHVRVTWLYLERMSAPDAGDAVARGIRALAEAHGVPGKYHETMTTAWLHLVSHHRREFPTDSFEAFFGRFPELGDKNLLARHYSSALLATPEARAERLGPDLLPLPVAEP